MYEGVVERREKVGNTEGEFAFSDGRSKLDHLLLFDNSFSFARHGVCVREGDLVCVDVER